ncbi:MAG: EscU/YscU/HrcU family type III secretion system export apparatus switch protein [Bacillota bacterium]
MKKKKIKEAAALKYSPGENAAPEIVALGRGEIAEKIIEKARDSNVPLYEDAALAHTLNFFKTGSEIPPELYGVVAQILVFVGRLDGKFNESRLSGGRYE